MGLRKLVSSTQNTPIHYTSENQPSSHLQIHHFNIFVEKDIQNPDITLSLLKISARCNVPKGFTGHLISIIL